MQSGESASGGVNPALGVSNGGVGASANGTHLLLPGTPDSLPRIREAVVSHAEQIGFESTDVAKIEMAVGEACSNIIEHAYLTQPLRYEIEVRVQPFPNRLEVTISIIPLSTSRLMKCPVCRSTITSKRNAVAVWGFTSFVTLSITSSIASSAGRATNSS
jgi:serine/threonine-protein kinase RsbW